MYKTNRNQFLKIYTQEVKNRTIVNKKTGIVQITEQFAQLNNFVK